MILLSDLVKAIWPNASLSSDIFYVHKSESLFMYFSAGPFIIKYNFISLKKRWGWRISMPYESLQNDTFYHKKCYKNAISKRCKQRITIQIINTKIPALIWIRTMRNPEDEWSYMNLLEKMAWEILLDFEMVSAYPQESHTERNWF